MRRQADRHGEREADRGAHVGAWSGQKISSARPGRWGPVAARATLGTLDGTNEGVSAAGYHRRSGAAKRHRTAPRPPSYSFDIVKMNFPPGNVPTPEPVVLSFDNVP